MSETYTKLFSSITDSTIWSEPDHTRIVWITMLAMADRNGYVGASVPGLASRARVPIDATERALETLLAPDTYSRSQEFDGRRIEVTDRGWNILNYDRFRDMRDEEARKEYERNRKRAARERAKLPDGPEMSQSVPDNAGQLADVPDNDAEIGGIVRDKQPETAVVPECLPQSAQAYTEASTKQVQKNKEQEVHTHSATTPALNAIPMDVWFEDLKRRYPPKAVSSGHMTSQAFVKILLSVPNPHGLFQQMLLNLETQKLGAQWSKGMIPKLEKWLREGLWEQVHEPAGSSNGRGRTGAPPKGKYDGITES